MIAQLLFYLLAIVLVVTAFAVVTSKNLVHSVFWLAAGLLATALIYVTLEAPFLAGIQVLLYTGGVITLMLFGVMMTQHETKMLVPNPSARQVAGFVVSGVLLALLLTGIWTTPELTEMTTVQMGTVNEIGMMFLNEYVIAFEAVSVLLLAAMIGAIVLARKVDA